MLIDLYAKATQDQVAVVVGVTQPTISVLISEGKLPSFGSLQEVVHAYCYRLREQAAGRMGSTVGGLDLAQERAALAREQRMGIEIKNAVLRGEYAPIGLLSQVLAIASQSIVERFEQLPSTLKKACPDLPDAAREQVMLVLAAARNEWVRGTSELIVAQLSEDDLDEGEDEAAGVDAEQKHE